MSDDIKPLVWVDGGHLREVSNGNEMLIFAASENTDRLEPLYDQATVESLQAKVVELEKKREYFKTVAARYDNDRVETLVENDQLRIRVADLEDFITKHTLEWNEYRKQNQELRAMLREIVGGAGYADKVAVVSRDLIEKARAII